MDKFSTNKYISLNIFNYTMFIANIGFLASFAKNSEFTEPFIIEIMFRCCYYYIFFAPFLIIILLVYLFKERKISKKEKNTKTQIIITTINLAIFFFILFSFIFFIYAIASIAHGLDLQ